MSELRQNRKRMGLLVLAICRGVYCWMFLIYSIVGIHAFYASLRGPDREHLFHNAVFLACCLVFGIAWWTLLRRKPSARQWAMAASVLIALPAFAMTITASWGNFPRFKLGFQVGILSGIVGILLFSIPYRGWRGRPPEAVGESASVDPDSGSLTNGLGRLMRWIALWALGFFRGAYCWIFFVSALFGSNAVYTGIQGVMKSHSANIGDVVSNTSMAVYSIVWGVAWWMIFRKRPSAQRWAIAANLIIILTYLPGIVTGSWRRVWELERGWWPFILFGIFGILIFILPYPGRKEPPPVAVQSATEAKA